MGNYLEMDNNLVTAEFFHLNNVLIKMVRNGLVSEDEREDLLHKSGLIKLNDGRWKESESITLLLANK